MILRVGARLSFPGARSKANGRPIDGVLELISLDRTGRLRVRKRPAIEKAQLRHLAASLKPAENGTRNVSNNETTARYLNDSGCRADEWPVTCSDDGANREIE